MFCFVVELALVKVLYGQTETSKTSSSFCLFIFEFVYSFTDIWFFISFLKSYLTTVMAFVTPWSISLALADTYSVLLKQLPHEPRLLSMVLAGDIVMSFLSLGGACGVASATELLSSMGAPICGDNLCSQYQVSATLAFLCWFLLLASALFNLWSLPSLLY